MQNRVTKKLLQHSFWLSVLLHVLLLLCILSIVALKPEPEKIQQQPPHYFVPAYTYTGSIKPSTPSRPQKQSIQKNESIQNETTQSNNKSDNKLANKFETPETAENIQSIKHTQSKLLVPKIAKKTPTLKKKPVSFQQSLLADSFNMLRDDQMREVTKKREAEPIYLIGDDHAPADPLIKLMGRSLSAHFSYPRVAGELGIRGRVIIGLTLHPEGHYSDVQMLRSSDNEDLDAAALYAVNSAPTVIGADRFISKPKHFVIGFVFN